MNIPNILSIFRILLAPCFVYSYFIQHESDIAVMPAAIVLGAGITDFLDGYVARKFDMETKLGKILDPLADKLTQITVVGCLAVTYFEFKILLAIYLVKELSMLIGGLWFIRKFNVVKVSRWFGKVATIEFYIAVLLVILFPGMPAYMFRSLVALTVALSLYAFVRYIIDFTRAKKIK